MSVSILHSDIYVDGSLSAKTMAIPDSSITNTKVAAGAAIGAEKMEHQFLDRFAQAHGIAAVTVRQHIKTAYGATGDIIAFRAATVVLNIGAATISIQLKKNGTNILTAALVLDTGNTAFIFESAAGFTSSTFVAGDFFEVDITATAGGGTLGQGLVCELITREDPQ